jgi:Tfp pilus assembly protein PilF
MVLREILRGLGWTICDLTSSATKALAYIRQGEAKMIILDDTVSMPSLYAARYLMTEPVAVCTPILGLLLPVHATESTVLSRLGVYLCEKPLTPSKFTPIFNALLRHWEKEPFAALRQANTHLLAGDYALATLALAKLMGDSATQHLSAHIIAVTLRKSGKLKDAEQVLLKSLKRNPRELTTILALVDLYLCGAMPHLAQKLLSSAQTLYPKSQLLVPDLVQANLMLGHIDAAIDQLSQVLKTNAADTLSVHFLARLLFAEGRETEAEKLLTAHDISFKKFHNAWHGAVPDTLPAAG